MKPRFKLAMICVSLINLNGCDDDNTQIVEVEKTVIVEEIVNEKIEIPVIVTVPVGTGPDIQVGPRPYSLIEDMDNSELKHKLQQCSEGPFYKTDFSIGHRGAPMQFPEHTKESYVAAARMGAGILECDVTFTKDKALVCRHSQCDLHTTTNILAIPELADKCSIPFSPADQAAGISASAKCCTSDITLAEFKQLTGKMDASDSNATTIAQYLKGTADWRTDLYANKGTLMTHAQSITLFKQLGVKMTPELKSPSVEMPFNGMSQHDYAQKMLDEYIAQGIKPEHVYPQSFNFEDIKYWVNNAPEFADQAVYLDGRYDDSDFDHTDPSSWQPSMEELTAHNIKIIAPPMWMLITIDSDNKIVPSEYAKQAKAAGLDIITWTLERSGPLDSGGGWYYQSVKELINNNGDQLVILDVLAKQVGVSGVFADWPGTVSYYASCMNLPASIL
ncbi:glycerophosphodiester phosphodiesterase family protein [Pseudoalteromonas denitrificans]|uniref:glycerophosphodiester phosphodiesterase n=1 Tax=Pseudoalteromonas denitrificans DSM 6059 TaxID=1123010 RepID=A0A1I1N552_9GAMM|nr:glycerophosphodiester phosphodiesterase family protein [Pseudoalteromonas denitrificans]SFC92476.1 glycerophosphoryl diester phosphodiesterase [Pseudoalteromonas denitrificans DSM 6059]